MKKIEIQLNYKNYGEGTVNDQTCQKCFLSAVSRLSMIENTRLTVIKSVQYKFTLSKYSGNIKLVVENDLLHLGYDKCFDAGLQMS